ncbi:NAD-dependent epimerase/dehydratase family protein [Duganella aceris]|uniref:NAD-dependent epimerase/dehydratase family protein n=1 Tax=Duganella aceris TaxID=2703883 RepID=A0ABX0FEX4_9BURK|nr:NAD-dependent epimerase/dehydratase family protein [Duganella aceris]NGZ83102.1 NAD-dependent epimerase/dehydratase family protein [Duganella aceris]
MHNSSSPGPYRPGVDAADLALILEQTPAEVWQALRGQHLFLTGGTGFIGSWLLEGLLWAERQLGLGLRLTVLSRRPDAFRARAPHLASHPAVRLLQGDVRDLAQEHGRYDIVLHAATDVVAPAAEPLATYHDIVAGAEQTLALARRCGAGRYLLTSSGAVYGVQPPGLTHVDEDYRGAPDPAQAGSAYGQGKRIAEWLVACEQQRQPALETRIARCFAFVGPYMALDAQFAIGNFIRDARRGDPIRVGGDGTPFRSYLYAADLVVWLLTILVLGDRRPYNVGAGQEISIAGLAREVSAALGGGAEVRIAGAPSGAPASYYVPSVARAAGLGLRQYTSLADAIARTAAWTTPHSGES